MSKTEIDNMNSEMQDNTANVLIDDGDPELPQFMLKILARKGIRGQLVNDKESANDFISRGKCDLVFTSDKISSFSMMSLYDDKCRLFIFSL